MHARITHACTHAHTHTHTHETRTPWPAQVREVMECAIEAPPPHDLPDFDCRSLCLRYAQLERKLGEVRSLRAAPLGRRGVWMWCLCLPKASPSLSGASKGRGGCEAGLLMQSMPPPACLLAAPTFLACPCPPAADRPRARHICARLHARQPAVGPPVLDGVETV